MKKRTAPVKASSDEVITLEMGESELYRLTDRSSIVSGASIAKAALGKRAEKSYLTLCFKEGKDICTTREMLAKFMRSTEGAKFFGRLSRGLQQAFPAPKAYRPQLSKAERLLQQDVQMHEAILHRNSLG